MIRIILVSLLFVILSCEKKPNATVDNHIFFLRNMALAEIYAEDLLTIVDEAYQLGKLESKSVFNPANSDAVITKDSKSMTIDFGSIGIEGKDLRTRKGKISISRAINEMDDIINSDDVKSKVTTLLEGLTTEEMAELTNTLKKKV
jgi:hypothetical protein